MTERVNRLRGLLAAKGVDAFLITRPENRYYLTGFTGTSGAVVVTRNEILLVTDFRYDEQAKAEAPRCRVLMAAGPLAETIAGLDGDLTFASLGCEGDYITHLQFCELRDILPGVGVVPLSGLVEELRAVKDQAEINMIYDAVRLSDAAFRHILQFVREGVSERDLALELEFFVRKNGAEGMAFQQITASGYRSAMPHGTASPKLLAEGELLTMDFGAMLSGYCSDITRTVAVGRADKKMEEIYSIVLEAQMAGIAAIRQGIPASEVDRASREVIGGYGYGENFRHSTGHGLGLQIHENPRLSSRDDTVLKKGMVVTVEPGIYLPGWGGVRIEDTVVVEENGCRVLTSSEKERLMVCG